MSNLDTQFEEFMKEPLSTGESSDTNSGSRDGTNANEMRPVPRKFWWMKERPQAEKTLTKLASNRSSFSGVSGDGMQKEGGYATVSPTISNMNVEEVPVAASHDVSSSLAEFLEKEKLCKDLSSSISEVDSPGMDLEFPGGDVTDDDIGSIMEQLSQLAGSADNSAADKSVEEILKEAEDLVRETSHSFSGLSENSDLLKLPITPGLIVNKMSVNLIPASTTSKKTNNKHLRTEVEDKDGQNSITKATTGKINSKSACGKMREKDEQLRSSRVGSSRKTDSQLALEEVSGGKFSDSRQVTYSGKHEDIGSHTDDGDTKVESMIPDSKFTKYVGNFSMSKEKELLKKEKTVTFEDDPHLFPKSTVGINKKLKGAVKTSSQKLQQQESNLKGKSSEVCNKDDDLFILESASLQPGVRNGLSARDEKHGDQLTKVVSVSPPLIQHGDLVGTPESLFQLITDEVRDEVVAALQESEKSSSQDSDHASLNTETEIGKIFGRGDSPGSTVDSLADIGTSFPRKPLSVVLEEVSVSQPSLGVDKLKDASTMTEESPGKELSDRSVQVMDSSVAEHVANLEKELLHERNTSLQLKTKLESEEQEHRKQLDALKCKHEEEIFTLKKDVIILNAKVTDFKKQQESSLVQKGGGDDAVREHRIALLEAELQQQEQLMLGYQHENIKLCQEMKQLKEGQKAKERSFTRERHSLQSARQGQEVERLTEQLKDKNEAIVQLQIEVESLRRVKDELAEREVQMEKIREELHSSQKEVATAKAEVTKSQVHVGALETKVSELQASFTKERAQTQAHTLRIEEDKKIIQDLNRQVKEMERILKRNHPNSISALILTANSEGTDQSPRIIYLENRIQQLEQELAKSQTDAQTSIKEIQDKFQAMKLKYEEHTSDLELQLATVKHQAHMWRQAAEKSEARIAAGKKAEEQPVREAKQSKKMTGPPMVITVGAPPANAQAVREDAHLLATIRGLKLELAAKDKELGKLRRDLDESAKTTRRLQKERERHLGVVTAPPRPPTVRGAVKEEQPSETSQQSGSRAYDPTRFEPPAPDQQEGVKRLEQENGMLREELLHLEEDYRHLQTKRLQDLNLLQEQHEAEMDHLISDHIARHSSSCIADLQGQLSTQQIVISHLKDQLKQVHEYQEEIEMLKAERDHLEKNNLDLRKKVADLQSMQTPEMLKYEALQEKLSELEYRHETREKKLREVVRDLLRRNAEHHALTREDRNGTTVREKLLDKNRQLCLYRAEVDRILETLREFSRHKMPGSTIQLPSD